MTMRLRNTAARIQLLSLHLNPHTAHYTLRAGHCTLRAERCTLCTAHCSLRIERCTLHTIDCNLDNYTTCCTMHCSTYFWHSLPVYVNLYGKSWSELCMYDMCHQKCASLIQSKCVLGITALFWFEGSKCSGWGQPVIINSARLGLCLLTNAALQGMHSAMF